MSATHVNRDEANGGGALADQFVTGANPPSTTIVVVDNNNVNKTPELNNNNNDEVIEEFDFSDSDFQECNDDSRTDSSNDVADNDDDDDDDIAVYHTDEEQPPPDKEMSAVVQVPDPSSAVAAVNACAVGSAANVTTIAINNEAHSHDLLTKGIATTATKCTAVENDSRKMEQVNDGSVEGSAAASNDAGATHGDNNDKNIRRITVPHLQLENEPTIPACDPFCPITPKRIVDVDVETDSDSLLYDSKNKVQGAMTAGDVGKEIVDAAATENDAGETLTPDDELLEQFLTEANNIAEARLAARRQARAEAREIRMRELERQQKEQEQNADRVYDMHTASGMDALSRTRLATGVNSSPVGALLNSTRGGSMSSRRSSEDSLEEEGRSLRDIRHELKDVEEKFRKAMIANAQLDNERASQTYQIQLLKDKLEEMEESYAQLQREFKEKSRDYNALKRNLDKLSEELKLVQGQLSERDTLITEQGLVIVAVENEEGTDAKRALVSVENAQLLGSVQGSLDVRLKKFSEEKQLLSAEVQQLQEQLENYKSQGRGRGNSMNGPLGSDDDYEAQREANKIISDYKYKLQKAEQEIASLQASLARSETQVIRYKSTAEAAEKAEAELKIERRKLQRENRETMERLEELETSNNHLLKRLDKLKNAKSALLKDL